MQTTSDLRQLLEHAAAMGLVLVPAPAPPPPPAPPLAPRDEAELAASLCLLFKLKRAEGRMLARLAGVRRRLH